MLYAFIFLLLVIITLAFLEDFLGAYNKYIYWGLCIILILFCAFRPVGVDPDSESYEYMFLNDEDPSFLVDASFLFLVDIFRIFTDDIHYLFLFYAIIGVSIKFYALRKLSPLYFLPLVIYLGNFYILHDYIQIRASIASALLLLSIKPLSEGKRKTALAFMLIATVFHSSSLIFIPILFFSNTISRIWKLILIGLFPVGVVVFILHLDFFTTIPIPFIEEKLEMYRALTEVGVFTELTLKYPFIWIHYAAILFSLYFYDTIIEKCPALPLLLKIMAYALFCYFAFSSVPVIAGRLHELLAIVELALLPCICYTIRPQFCGKIVVCTIGIIEFVLTLFVWKLLDFSVA